MPFAEFQPSNAGAQVNDQILRNVDFGASLIERAQRSRVMAEDAEQRKQRFVMDQMTSDVALQQQRLRLSQMEGEQKAIEQRNRAAVAESDSRFDHLASSERMVASAAAEATSLAASLANEEDPDAIEFKTNDFLGKYSTLATDKEYGVRFNEVARPVTNVVSTKIVAIRQKAAAAANIVRKLIASGDPAAMAAARSSEYLSHALRDAAFKQEWATLVKADADRANKLAENADAANLKLKEIAAQGDETRKTNAAKGDTDKPQAPQFLVDRATKINQAAEQLNGIEAAFAKMETGPMLGFFRDINPYDTDAQAFKAKLTATVPNLARGVFGEVGVLTDFDVTNYLKTLPNLKTPKDRAKLLVDQLRQVLNTQQTSIAEIVKGQGYRTGGIPGMDKAQKPAPPAVDPRKQALIDEAARRGLRQPSTR